jgi:hypothetical protein
VAFSNSSLAFIKEGAASTAGLDYIEWPHQPFKLLPLGSSGTAVVCADSTVWHIAFEDDRIPAPSMLVAFLQLGSNPMSCHEYVFHSYWFMIP